MRTLLPRTALLAVSLAIPVLADDAVPAPAPAPISKSTPAPVAKLDEGLLDPAWFGEGISFAKSDDVDFFWMKPGLDLNGRTIQMKAWDDPAMLKPKRDGKDNAVATRLTDAFPGILRGAIAGALTGKVKISRNEGDLDLVGRFVDANAGSRAAKFLVGWGAGSETATWDLKILDPKTKEVLLAIHHRCISGTALSTIDDKLVKWADKFAQFMAQRVVK